MEREAREAREPQALQATQEQRERQEEQEQACQHHEEQPRKSGKSSPSLNTGSVHDRLGREHEEEHWGGKIRPEVSTPLATRAELPVYENSRVGAQIPRLGTFATHTLGELICRTSSLRASGSRRG